MERQKNFIVNGENYLFDGNSVSIILNNQNLSKELPCNELNAQRSSHLKSLCLVIDNCCNLCCDYCFANKGMYDKPNELMTFETAKKAIDFLVTSVVDHGENRITIAFFGGEPLLNFNLMKECVEYINTFNKIKCEYMITTNGTVLNAYMVEFLEKYQFNVTISIDGNKELHDLHRRYKSGKGSYDDVVNGIHLFKNRNLVNARITINNHNPEIHSYIDDILNLDVKRVTFAVDYNVSDEVFAVFVESMKKLLNKYYDDIMNEKYYDITNFSSIITTIALHHRKLTFCNAGISYLTVSADGKYYKCPRFVGKKDFVIDTVDDCGKVKEELEIFKKSLKESPGERNEQCEKCSFEYICGGMCYHHAVMSGKSEFENVSRECYQRKIMFNGIIEMICKLPTENRRKLLLYYINLWNTVKEGKAL